MFNDNGLNRMFEAARLFAASLNYTQPYWLTLSGNSGIGKTHLARAVWRQFMDQNRFEKKLDPVKQCIYGNTANFVNWRQACARFKSGSFDLIDDYCQEWFVIFDDIGAERDTSGFIASALDRILNERKGKWTLITTNLTFEEIDGIDKRMSSRLLRDNGTVIECNSIDYAHRSQK